MADEQSGRKVRVKMLTTIAGLPSYRDGQIVDLRSDVAAAWLKEGYCELVREEPVEVAVTSGRR